MLKPHILQRPSACLGSAKFDAEKPEAPSERPSWTCGRRIGSEQELNPIEPKQQRQAGGSIDARQAQCLFHCLLAEHEKEAKKTGVHCASLGQVDDNSSLEPDGISETNRSLIDVPRGGRATKLYSCGRLILTLRDVELFLGTAGHPARADCFPKCLGVVLRVRLVVRPLSPPCGPKFQAI
jgi:hypothetical protein